MYVNVIIAVFNCNGLFQNVTLSNYESELENDRYLERYTTDGSGAPNAKQDNESEYE